jgi:hypothetical protein
MQFNFTESDYTGEYQFGGRLEIVAETPNEVESLIKHFRLFKDMEDVETLKARIAALESSTLSHTIGTDKRPAYAVTSCLGFEFTEPYKAWALRNFGYDGVFPDLELPREWGGLIHTNYQSRVYTEGEHICFTAFTTAQPWARKSAQDYADSLVSDYIAEEYGTRRHEPEYIQARNNFMVKNPDYLKRHKATPQASNATLKRAFFEWWRANHANAEQLAIIEGNEKIVAETGSYMDAFGFERFESHIYYGRKLGKDGKTQDYKAISFSDFAALGVE